ncbi:MAG: hypothetical protein N2323_05125 [candidate division WOR-3 bacterium]|nr:hypothetical protein [candidate division WOR-3 bacterium]MCX7837322.1 hypothetical protein [candidate division WOR-3 bacterium]MDW8114615.1 hypothetical protein [candidate division WOR-3 bacterium]
MMSEVGTIVLTHSQLAFGYQKILEKMFGVLEDTIFLSNEGLSFEELKNRLAEEIKKLNKAKIIIFVDIIYGSCAQAATELKKENENIKLVCGFNLPSLIKFFTYKDKKPLEELLKEVISSGKEGIKEI